MENAPNISQETLRNWVEIKSEKALFNIVYSNHSVESTAASLVGSEAIALELILNSRDSENIARILKEMSEEGVYKEIIRYSKEYNIPLYFVDTLSTHAKNTPNAVRKSVTIAGEAVVAHTLGKSAIKDLSGNVSRRSFLKGLGKLVSSVHLASPIAEQALSLAQAIGGDYNESSSLRKTERFIKGINESTHPELDTALTEGRNLLIAQKMSQIADNLSSKDAIIDDANRPKISLFIGANHTAVETDLNKNDKKRLSELRDYFSDDELQGEEAMIKVSWKEENGAKVPQIETVKVPLDQ